MTSGIPSDPTSKIPSGPLQPLAPATPAGVSAAEDKTAKVAKRIERSSPEPEGELPGAKKMRMSTGGDPVKDVGRAADLLDFPFDEIVLVSSDQFLNRPAPLTRQDTFYAPLGPPELRAALQKMRSEAQGDVSTESVSPKNLDEGATYHVSSKSLLELIGRLKDFVQFKLGLGEEAQQLKELERQYAEKTEQAKQFSLNEDRPAPTVLAGADLMKYQAGIQTLQEKYQIGVVAQEEVRGIVHLFAKALIGDSEAKVKQIHTNISVLRENLPLISPSMQAGFQKEITRLEKATDAALKLPLKDRQTAMQQLKEVEQQLKQLHALMALEEEYSNLQEQLANINKGAYRSLPELIQADAHVKEINAETNIDRLTADALMQIRGDLTKAGQKIPLVEGLVSKPLSTKASNASLLANFEEQVVAVISADFPSLPLTRGRTEGEGRKSDFNNYAITADDGSIMRDPDTGQLLSFEVGGQRIENRRPGAIVEGNKIYSDQGESLYHDATRFATTTNGARILTVCDGSGHKIEAKLVAEQAASASEAYLLEHVDEATNLQEQVQLQLRGFKAGHDGLPFFQVREENADTTFVQCVVRGNVLSGVSLGDSKAFVFRPQLGGGWQCIDATNYFKGAFQTSYHGGAMCALKDDPSHVHKMRAFAMTLQEGDVVYVASDGVVDGFDPVSTDPLNGRGEQWNDNASNPHLQEDIRYADQETARRMEAAVRNAKNGAEIQSFFESHLRDATLDRKIKKYEDPKYIAADRDGAKFDDAGSVFFEFKGIGG